MKIKRIWVERYGSIAGLSIPNDSELTDGLNIIFGPNEAGKSQLKGFLEQLLFPKSGQRIAKELKPLGRSSFLHDGVDYTLEALKKGSSNQRYLYRQETLMEGDVTDLFPSLASGGSEVFSNLYSFGLDQLFAGSTSGSGILSEHLFGAIAGGKGISISSVFDELDDRIRRLTGRDSRFRSLSNVLEDLDEAEEKRRQLVSEQAEFIHRYRKRDELFNRVKELKITQSTLERELSVRKEVQRMADSYEAYIRSMAFLEDYPGFSSLDKALLEEVESLYSRVQGLTDSIEDATQRKRASVLMLQPLLSEITLAERRNEVQVLEKILEDVDGLNRELAEKKSRVDAGIREIRRIGRDSSIDVDPLLEKAGSFEVRPRLEVLENVRGNLDLLQRQRNECLSSPLVDANMETLLARKKEVDGILRSLSDQFETSLGRGEKGGDRFERVLFIVALVAAVVITGTLAGSHSLPGTLSVIIGLAVVLGSAVSAMLLAKRRRRKVSSHSSNGGSVVETLAADGADSRSLARRLEDFQSESHVLDAIIRVRLETDRIAEVLSSYGILIDGVVPIERMTERVSIQIALLREMIDLGRIRSDVDQVESRADQRLQDLIDAISSSFPEIDVSQGPSKDLLWVIVERLSDRLSSSLEIAAKVEDLKREISSIDSEVERLCSSLARVRERIDRILGELGYSDSELDEDLVRRFRGYVENRTSADAFIRSVESVFGVGLEEVQKYFGQGRLDNANIIDVLDGQIDAVQRERDSFIRIQAEIDSEEKRLASRNLVAEAQANVESLRLEAEELLGEVRSLVLARQMLRNANKRFEDFHQPELLRISSEIFERVTQGRYVKILRKELQKGNAIFARSESGLDVQDELLSRGTREQLYISIRLALVTRKNSLDLPLLMDDVMVNSDIERAHGLAKELARVAENRQILYFCAKPDAINLFEVVGADINLVEMQRL